MAFSSKSNTKSYLKLNYSCWSTFFLSETFWNKNQQFNNLDEEFVLYHDNSKAQLSHLVVAAKYKQCADSSNEINNCHCATFVRLKEENPEFAYLDFCSEPFEVQSIDQVKIKYYGKKELFELTFFSMLNCSKVLSSENEENEWTEVAPLGNFKCARLGSSSLIVSLYLTLQRI